MVRSFFAFAGISAALVFSCSIYDASLLEGSASSAGGQATSSPSTTETSSSSLGGATSTSTMNGSSTTTGTPASSVSVTTGGSCAKPSDCGADTECLAFTCAGGVCGTSFTDKDTPLAQQTAGDCQTAVCDGSGGTTADDDDADVDDDMNECTTDTCNAGAPVHTPVMSGMACAGGEVCDANGNCVQCLDDSDCASGVCNQATNTCSLSSCNDSVKNGSETATDCGGSCSPCINGDACLVDGDCKSHKCQGMICQQSCSDGMADEGETDIDCGGPNCGPCAIGEHCSSPSDCTSNACSNGFCACSGSHLVISEIKTRGMGGAGDEFVEIYNPESSAVMLDTTWKVDARGSNATGYTNRWVSPGGITIPSHAHFLIGGVQYAGSPAKDASISSGISDAASVRLVQNGNVVDAICYYFSASTQMTVTGAGYTCEGNAISNLPHNDTTAGQSNTDVSLERKPGGALGNCIDTDDSAGDFQSLAPSNPQGSASATTP